MVKTHKISISQACNNIGLSRSSYYYSLKTKNDTEVIEAINSVIDKHPRYGFYNLFKRLRRKGFEFNHKKVYRVYRALGLNIRRKTKRRLPERIKQPLVSPLYPNELWSMDYMSDTLWSGKGYRVLNIIDEFNREFLEVEIDSSLPSSRVIDTLQRACEYRGYPKAIRVDNGPEFISNKLEEWCEENNIELQFIEPGKPTQNSRVERFNGTLRRELLDAYIFRTLKEARETIEWWMSDYNRDRSHSSLGDLSPLEYLEKYNHKHKESA